MIDKKVQMPLQRILKNLVESSGLRVSEIAREVKMPETTIRYILYGITKQPSAETLKKLADFFGVTIDYLIGKNRELQQQGTTDFLQNSLTVTKVPLIDLDRVKQWAANQDPFDFSLVKSWVVVEENMQMGSFAVCFDRAIKGLFYEKSVLLVDSNGTIDSGDYVIASVNKKKPTIKRVWKEQENYYLEPVGTKEDMDEITEKNIVFGKIIEVRRYL